MKISDLKSYKVVGSIGSQTMHPNTLSAPTSPSFGQRVSSDIQTAGSNINDALSGAGQGQYAGQSIPRRAMGAVEQGFGAIGNVASEALPQGARDYMSKVGGAVGDVMGNVGNVISDNKSLQSFTQNHPTATNVATEAAGTLSSAGNIAGTILGADQGAKVLQAGAEATAGGIKNTGTALKAGGKKLYDSAYDYTADEAQAVQGNKIKSEYAKQSGASPEEMQAIKDKAPKTRADTALERGISGTEKQIGVKSGVEKMGLWDKKIEPALKGSTDTISKDELFSKAEERVASEVEPTRKAAMQNALDAVKEDYKDFSNADLVTANKIKTSLDNFTPSKIFKGQDVASELKTIKADMASAIREKTYSSLKEAHIKTAYRDYSNLKQLENVGIKALTEGGLKGGFGSFWSTLYDQAATPVKTVGGKMLYRVGNKLEFVGEKGIKTLGQHLENLGFVQGMKDNVKNGNRQGGFVKNPLAGDTRPSVTPESTKGMMSSEDLQTARSIVHGNSLNDYMKAEPLLKQIGIDKLSINDQIRFLKEAIDVNTKTLKVKEGGANTSTRGGGGLFTGSLKRN